MTEKFLREEYLNDGGSFCPFCKGRNVDGARMLESDGEGGAFQDKRCSDCGGGWLETYKLVDIYVNHYPKKKTGG